MEKGLPHCTPYPGPCSVIILDNASIHKNIQLQELCEEQGVLLKFLPPYSPDYNPIEATFKDLKEWIKRSYRLAADFEDFGDFLHFAVSQCRGLNAKKHFREVGYIVDSYKEDQEYQSEPKTSSRYMEEKYRYYT